MSVIWITGLPGVGKTEAARCVVARLRAAGEASLLLDGDELRRALQPVAGGYDAASRRRLADVYASIAELVATQDITAVVATVSLFSDLHAQNRRRFDAYLEVLLACDETERRRRRPAAHANGPHVGIDIAPELPAAAHLVLHSDECTPDEIAAAVVAHWRSRDA